MTAGDVFSNMCLPVTGSIDIIPAVGVQVMISFVAVSSTNLLHFGGTNAVGTTAAYRTGYGAGTTTEVQAIQNSFNMKMFITNSQYFSLICDAGTHNMSYSGIEM